MANVKKCPLCGGDVIGNYCFSCGIDLPDEQKLADFASPEPERTSSVRSASTAGTASPDRHIQVEEVYRDDYPNIKVADNRQSGQQWHQAGQSGQYGQHAQSGQQTQYEQSGQSSNDGGFGSWTEYYANLTTGEKFKKYWWFILLMVFVPGAWFVSGLFALITVITRSDKASKIFARDFFILAAAGLFIFG